jgi:hypothetical protein
MRLLLLGTLSLSAALAQTPGPIRAAVEPQYETAQRNFVEAAEAMPEAEYGYRLTPAQRPWGEWIHHTAGMNLRMCAQMKAETPPAQSNGGDMSKAALVKAIRESFAYCQTVIGGMNDAAALSELTVGTRKTTPLAVMVAQLAQLNSHYGNMVGYLRTKGITPPSTARNQKK